MVNAGNPLTAKKTDLTHYYYYKCQFASRNSVVRGQTPRFAASDLGHHCWSMWVLLLWETMHKWVNWFEGDNCG